MVHEKTEYSCIPDNYIVMSREKYEKDQEALIECGLELEYLDEKP